MADLPILFSPPMICSLVREIEQPGTGKTQTRRTNGVPVIERTQSEGWHIHNRHGGVFTWSDDAVSNIAAEMLPFQPGDRLWCREEHYQFGHWEVADGKLTKGGREKWQFVPDTDEVLLDPPSEFRWGRHHQDPGTPAWHKRLGRFMFRCHSRLTLYVTDVRVQRLQDISEEDARAEGVGMAQGGGWRDYRFPPDAGPSKPDPIGSYRTLWRTINGPGAWDANPWVAAYTFVPVLGSITTLPAVLADLPSHAEGSQP